MRLGALIFSGLILLQFITMNMFFTDYAVDGVEKFEERRLQIAVNYAVDAATKEMKDTSANLGQDYTTMGKLNVDPTSAFDTFSTIICKNYDIPCSEVNRQSVMLDYCPVFCVATYDGYYITDRVTINDSGVVNMMFGTKMPYLYRTTDPTNGKKQIYSLNLSLKQSRMVDEDGMVYRIDDPIIPENQQARVISNTLSNVLNEYIVKYASKDPRGMVYIPPKVNSLNSTNPVKNTTVFAYIDNFDLTSTKHKLQSFGIGGSEIKQNKVVVGFIKDGIKRYTYSGRLPEGVHPIESFDSPGAAAQAGYYFYAD